DEVRSVIEAPDVGSRNAAISAHLRRMESELEHTRETVKSLRLLLDEDTPAAIDISYRTVGSTRTIAIRDRLAFADVGDWLTRALVELRAALGESGGRRAGPDAALYSSELLEDQFGEIVALVPISSVVGPVGRIRPQELEATEYAVATHVGSVENLDRT